MGITALKSRDRHDNHSQVCHGYEHTFRRRRPTEMNQ